MKSIAFQNIGKLCFPHIVPKKNNTRLFSWSTIRVCEKLSADSLELFATRRPVFLFQFSSSGLLLRFSLTEGISVIDALRTIVLVRPGLNNSRTLLALLLNRFRSAHCGFNVHNEYKSRYQLLPLYFMSFAFPKETHHYSKACSSRTLQACHVSMPALVQRKPTPKASICNCLGQHLHLQR